MTNNGGGKQEVSREHSLRAIAHAVTRFQEEIADMLDAKATEAEKVRNWITLHMLPHDMEDYSHRLKQAMHIENHMLEVIDGLSKMESSLGLHLKLLIGQEEPGGPTEGHGEHGDQSGGGFDMDGK